MHCITSHQTNKRSCWWGMYCKLGWLLCRKQYGGLLVYLELQLNSKLNLFPKTFEANNKQHSDRN